MKKHIFKFFLLILLVSFGLLFYWNSFSSPLERDEGEYFYSAQLLKDGDVPYENSFLLKPPMIIYSYLTALFIDPDSVIPPRIIAFAFTILTAICIGLIAKKEYGKTAGLFAMFLFIPMSAFPFLAPFAANTERFMQLPLVAVLTLYVYFKNSQKFWPYFWAGFLSTIAISFKQICILPIIVIFVFWIVSKTNIYPLFKEKFVAYLKKIILFEDNENTNQTSRDINFRGLLFSIPVILGMLMGFLSIFGYLFASGSFGDFWEINYKFAKFYAAQFDSSSFMKYMGIFFNNWWLLCILLFWSAIGKIKNFKFYIILIFASFLSVFMSPIGHYYLLLLPFWTIVSSASLADIIKNLESRANFSKNQIKKYIFRSAVLAFTIFILIIPVKEQFSKSPDEINLWIYGVGNPFDEARILGDKLRKITSDKDYVFIAGSEPEILFYSKKKSSSSFVITYPLIIKTPFLEQYQNKAVQDLKNNPPKAIVYSNQEESGLYEAGAPKIFKDYLDGIIKENYQPIGGFIRNKDLSGQWKEPIGNEEIPMATLVLYKKK